jgi:two-component system sensor histidine kinase DesK
MSIPAFLHPTADSLWADMKRSNSKPWLQLLNLMWSLWVLATLFFTSVTAAFWWSLAIGYPLFLLLFVLVNIRPIHEMKVYAGTMALLAFASMYWNPSAWSYAVFACVFAGFSGAPSLASGALRIVMIEAVLVIWAWWLDWPWFIMLMAVSVCSASGFGSLLGRINQMKSEELRLSHEEVRRLAATAERERIGRDLHDLLGHTLSLITLKLELSRRLFDRDHEAARRELEEAERVARHALAEVRDAVTGFRATGIAAELASARLLLQGSGVRFDHDAPRTDLPEGVECALALMLREAVTNIHRHARARHVEANLVSDAHSVRLTIIDDGRGGIAMDGNGLSGMRERVRALDGTLDIESPAGCGTRLQIVVPRKGGPSEYVLVEPGAMSHDEGMALGTSGGRA